jgi:hypothetical protein
VRLPVPKPDAERLPTLRSLDEVLGADTSPSRVMRDLGGHPVEVRVRTPANVHELTAIAANDDESGDDTSRLPAPPMPLLTRHDRLTLGQMIERHIQWLTEPTRFSPPEPVALPTVFLDHYLAYRDSTLPHVASVVTMPLVLPDGTPLDSEGLVERFQWYFCIDPDLQRCIPDPDRCTPREAADALNYLANTFLVDVATDFAGKCVLIAMMMTIIERVLLPERPAFFVTAGKRGGGKTTALCMAMLALTGKKPPAAAWSNNEEERRKAVLSYLRDGLGFIVWDNIPLGSSISCPTIEKVLTSDTYSDRILGETKNLTVPCTTVLGFTGNNISPKGDLSSRSLTTRIEVEQPDPENRPFKHPDPIGWTLDHRGDIINAIYTLLLVKARQPHQGQAKTRFKTWWRLVGRPIELAASELVEIEAQLPEEWRTAKPIDFASLFAAVEADDEEVASLTETLEALHAKWPSGFKAASVLEVITDHTFADEDADILRSFFRSKDGRTQPSTVTIGKRLSELKGTPVLSDAGTLKLVVLPMRDHAREYQVTLRPR